MVNEDDILEAVERRTARDGSAVNVRAPGAASLSWHSMLDCRIVRSVETRREVNREQPGAVDLSGRPTYEVLSDYPFAPPQDPAVPRQLRLVLADSVRVHICDCGNGQWTCSRCKGSGRIPCEPTMACDVCRGLEPCTECQGTGTRRKGPAAAARRKPAPQGTSPTASGKSARRTSCLRCGALDAACSSCRGRAVVSCTACRGSGSLPCPECESSGTVSHEACGGTGRRTSWTEGIISHAPEKTKVSLPRSGPPFLVRQRTGSAGEWREAVLRQGDPLPKDLDDTHRAALEPQLARTAGEVALRADLRYLPLARVVVHDNHDKVFYAFPGRSDIEVVPLPSQRRVARISGVTFAAAAVLVLILLLVR